MFSMWRICSVFLICANLAMPTSANADQGRLFTAIGERLGWMASVAAWKYSNDVQVEDLEREALVLESATADAEELGLSSESVRDFFQAQIDAAKAIQWCWIETWQSGASPIGEAPDLATEIRPELIRLGREVLQELEIEISQSGPILEDKQGAFLEAIPVECLDDHSRIKLFEGLSNVRLQN